MSLIEQIRAEVNSIAKEESIDDSKAFVIWICEQYYGLTRAEAIDVITDSGNDKRIDAFHETDDTLYIIQSKLFEDEQKEVGEKEISIFKGCLDWLKQPEEIKKLNIPKLYDASLTFNDKWREGVNVELHYFALGKFSFGAMSERRVFNNSDQRSRVQMHFHDVSDILNSYQANLLTTNPLADESVTFDLPHSQFFIRQEGSFPAIVFTLKGKTLASLHERFGNRLFERNIRLFRGVRKGSINAGIIDTIKKTTDRKKFWYFNNGISFVCSDFILNDKITPSKVTIKGPQIINGCQTTVCLTEAKNSLDDLSDIPDEIDVLVRFIKAPIKEVEYITLYTNSQNPVSEAQLKSNDPIQQRLKQNLDDYNPPYFYSIKEGDRNILSKEQKQKYDQRYLDIIRATQALYAFTEDPAYARRYRNELFSKKYSEIFSKDTEVEELLLPWRILVTIDQEISKYRQQSFNKLKQDPNHFTQEQREEILRKEFLLYSNLLILYFIHNLINKRYSDYTPEIAKKLLNKKLESRVKSMMDYIVAALSFSDKLKAEKNLPRFLKNIDNINSLYSEVEKEIEKDKAMRKDPLNEFLPNL